MNSIDNTIMYFCYGSVEVYHQAIYSILSLLRVDPKATEQCRIIVYCDRPQEFMQLPVETVTVYPDTLERWLGGGDYIHRRKTCAILTALERFGGKLIFVDSDTYFKRSPLPLFGRIGPGRACFHILEGYICSTGTTPDLALVRQLRQDQYFLSSGEVVTVGLRTPMWNTGVVGVDAADIRLVREALELSDAIWARADPGAMDGKKIHHAEQFAMGYVFRDCRLTEAARRVFHYWPWPGKNAFNAVLPELVRSGLSDCSIVNLNRLYRFRVRQTGFDRVRDQLKMILRHAALLSGVHVRGVRRSIF